MPYASPKNCARPACYKVSIYGKRYCEEHTKQKDKADYELYRKNDAGQKVYKSALWKKSRASFLAQHPFCSVCRKEGRLTAATEVDHLIPIAQGHDPWDVENWDSKCASCHAKKTAAEVGFSSKG